MAPTELSKLALGAYATRCPPGGAASNQARKAMDAPSLMDISSDPSPVAQTNTT